MKLRLTVAIGAAVVLLGAAVQLQAIREGRYPEMRADDESSLSIRSDAAVRRIAGTYAPLGADLYWIRALQYYGGIKHRLSPTSGPLQGVPAPPYQIVRPEDDYSLLAPLLEITTTLDPRFNIAYRFGAIFLAEPYPNGPGRPDLAIALLQKGLRERPDKWEYVQDIAFVHYWYDHDYLAASEWFQKAADVPGAPWWLRSMAATTRARGGDRESSRLMWETIRQTTEIDFLRKDAERRLLQLRALDDIDALQRVVDSVRQRSGAPPTDWPSLVRAGALRGIPVDPTGVPYELRAAGRVMLSSSSPLSPLLEEPPAEPATR